MSNLLFFVNCTDPSSTCTSLSQFEYGLGGVNGYCNMNTGICECPSDDQVTGADLIGTWNDCHISLLTMNQVQIVGIAFCVIGMLASVIGILVVLQKWKIIELNLPARKTNDHDSSPDFIADINETSPLESGQKLENLSVDSPTRKSSKEFTGNYDGLPTTSSLKRPSVLTVHFSKLQSPPPNAPSKVHQKRVADIRRRQKTLFLLSCFCGHSITSCIYQTTRFTTGTRFEQGWWVQLLSLSLAICFIIPALWMLVYLWYCNLPNLMVFASMFPFLRNNLLVKRPQFIKFFAIFDSTFTCVAVLIFYFILPVINPSFVPWSMLQVGCVFIATFIMSMATTLIGVCLLLLKLFHQVKVSSVGNDATANFSQAARTVRTVLILSIVAGSGAPAMILTMGFDWNAKRNFYFLIPLLLACANLVVLVGSGVFAGRMQ